LPLFERVYASDGTVNLSRTRKRDRLVADFGEQGYDYAGNAWADLPVWHDARQAIVVSRSVTLLARARAQARVAQVFADTPPRLLQWPRALRMHQWIKNLLLFLPLLLSQKFTEPKLLLALWGFAAFCLCASSVYLLNDLLDMPSDRLHPRKRLRPFASGELPALDGLLLAPLLLGMALVIALEISRWFTSVLLVYYASTLAYSMYLKRIPLIDVMLLAGLYTLRIVAGAAAIGVPLTFWLLAFSMFLFLSLGTMKRYTELAMVRDSGAMRAAGRGYHADDLPLLRNQGVAAGYGSVLVLALYINSPQSLMLYRHPHYLWLLCPLLLYWISRAWMKTHRGLMHDDPIVFALRDIPSLTVGVLMAAAVAIAALL
ncbi:MAG TPA: UbiA family prenyltransferase, partial [Nevskiaceae bacterium]|nr:UbiA family prenyltransferase [Nevskiaceae bacterium]